MIITSKCNLHNKLAIRNYYLERDATFNEIILRMGKCAIIGFYIFFWVKYYSETFYWKYDYNTSSLIYDRLTGLSPPDACQTVILMALSGSDVARDQCADSPLPWSWFLLAMMCTSNRVRVWRWPLPYSSSL